MASKVKSPAFFVVRMLRVSLGMGPVGNTENGEAGQVSTAVTRGLEIFALLCWLLGVSGTSMVRLKLCPFSFFNFSHGKFQLDRRVEKVHKYIPALMPPSVQGHSCPFTAPVSCVPCSGQCLHRIVTALL